jgi:hypothetical protein
LLTSEFLFVWHPLAAMSRVSPQAPRASAASNREAIVRFEGRFSTTSLLELFGIVRSIVNFNTLWLPEVNRLSSRIL